MRDDAQYLRDVYNVERIEVLKGPNAMVFGRGGGGGVINRVTKDAGADARAVVLESGVFGHRRAALDVGRASMFGVGGRLNGAYENSGSCRDRVRLAQINVENIANVRYYPTSQGNNNILPGAPRTLRVSLATGF